MIPIVAAAGAFVLTFVLQAERTRSPLNKTSSNRNRHREDDENLDVEEAQDLADKLSSHVLTPTPSN